MTAPLQMKKNNTTKIHTLQSMEKKVQHAINNHDLEETDMVLSQMLDMHISQAYLGTLYCYANDKNEKEICQYLKHILFVNNNTCNII